MKQVMGCTCTCSGQHDGKPSSVDACLCCDQWVCDTHYPNNTPCPHDPAPLYFHCPICAAETLNRTRNQYAPGLTI